MKVQRNTLNRGLVAQPWKKKARVEFDRWFNAAGEKDPADVLFAIAVREHRAMKLVNQVAWLVAIATFGIAIAALFAATSASSGLAVFVYFLYGIFAFTAAVQPLRRGSRNTQELVRLYGLLHSPTPPPISWWRRVLR